VDTIEQDAAEEMWHALRHDIIRQWQYEMGTDPDASPLHLTLYNFQGSLEVRFDQEKRTVDVTLRHDEDVPGLCEEYVLEYEPVATSAGRRYWRREKFEHEEEGMGRLIVYHLLKYRIPAEVVYS
jgi:hypothetical protein